jgi:hypothetical protein
MTRNEGPMSNPDEVDPNANGQRLARDAQQAQASSRDLEAKVVEVANAVARTEDSVAATMDRMAELQPHRKDRLKNLAEAARKQAAYCRRWARDHSPASKAERARRADAA